MYSPPMRIRSALVTPMEPLMRPIRRSTSSGGGASPSFASVIGVAAVIASGATAVVHCLSAPHGPCAGRAHRDVSATGKQIYTKQRPAMAGLKTFRPNPPNTSFPKAMANTMPKITTCQGTLGGITRAKMMALTKTASVTGSPRFLQNRYSVRKPPRAA